MQIFISYRRADLAAEALVVKAEMEKRFPGQVFVDDPDLEEGRPYPEGINRAVERCDAFLALIGPRWPVESLHRDTDWVRAEIRTALRLGKKLVPVLVQGGVLPAEEDLPEDIRVFNKQQTYKINELARDSATLARQLEGRLPLWSRLATVVRRRRVATIAAAASVLALAVVGASLLPSSPETPLWTCVADPPEAMTAEEVAMECPSGWGAVAGQRAVLVVSRKQRAGGSLTARTDGARGVSLSIQPQATGCVTEDIPGGSRNARLNYVPSCFEQRADRFSVGFDLIMCTSEPIAGNVDLFAGVSLDASEGGKEEEHVACKRSR